MLTITLIGTAATMPLPDRALTTAFAECRGHGILFDCGEGTQAAARRAGVNLMKADVICLTHYHGDHIFGLPGLLQTLACQGRTRPLYIFGPEGLHEVFSAIHTLAGPLPYQIKTGIADKEPICLDKTIDGWPSGAALYPISTHHRVPSRGYKLVLPRAGRFMPEKARELGVPVNLWKSLQKGDTVEFAGCTVMSEQVLGEPRKSLSFVFSGDTAVCPALEDAVKDVDLFICDATYSEPEQVEQAKQYGHSTFGQMAALASRAGAKRLWLAHYSPMITEPESALPQARLFYPEAECGFDGKRITLQYGEDAPQ